MTGFAYSGPECPFCHARLGAELNATGTTTCSSCATTFYATLFDPPQRKLRVAEVAAAGPQGASACANHARNAAVTSCDRCGLFICSLCEMNTGGGSYCPACFDRLRTEGAPTAGTVRYRDYILMAWLSVGIGVFLTFTFFFASFGGIAALFFASRGFKQIRERGGSRVGLILVIIIAILEILGGLALAGFFVYAIAKDGLK
ncbi:MAG TPA: hypothetical protein VF618_19280 [Thermoanaerobaculia bacterium]